MSVFSVLCTLVLFSELSNRWVAMALPESNVENGINEEDNLGLMLKDQTISEPALVFLMRRSSTGLASNIQDKGTPQLNMPSDMHLRGQDTSRSSPGFKLTDWNARPFPKTIKKMDRRNNEIDVLRCMIGRVYRPCWDA
ncbi:pro-MCH [Eucyclogobius newberryi]|uniref:pro-MCH n=1 Tax=Eucyclogobius newberryi TaxID=166745 RepID=UPI003B5B2CDD